jgi:hypothetical protein
MSVAGRWLPAALLVALVVPVPHANAVTAAECSGRYTVTADTVTDNDTGLTWVRKAKHGSDCSTMLPAIPCTWNQAQTYCQNLTLAGGGWRVPTLFELQTLVDESVTAPSLDSAAFNPSTENGLYWSSTPYASDSTQTWVVNFGVNYTGGVTQLQNAMFAQNSVRCVRP